MTRSACAETTEACAISTPDDVLWHGVATAADAVAYSGHREIRAGQPEEDEMKGPTSADQAVDPRREGAAGQGGLEGEGCPAVSQGAELPQHHAATGPGAAAGAPRQEVGIDVRGDSQPVPH